MRRTVAILLAATLLLTALAIALVNECSSIGGMGWSVVRCECSGIEWTLYDQTEGDGPMRSLCLGRVRSRTCYQYVDGPLIACAP